MTKRGRTLHMARKIHSGNGKVKTSILVLLVVFVLLCLQLTSNPRTLSKIFAIPWGSSEETAVEMTVNGKSCKMKSKTWVCQECSNSTCHTLKPKDSKCPMGGAPNEIVKHHVETSPNGDRYLILRGSGVFKQQPGCSVTECWDWKGQCVAQNNTVNLTVFVNGTTKRDLVQYAQQHSQLPLKLVDNHEEACIIIVFTDTYQTYEELAATEHWSFAGNGQNHLLWFYSNFPYTPRRNGDSPFQLFDPGRAALASESLDKAYLRHGYDMPLALLSKKLNFDRTADKSYLVQFRGKAQTTTQAGHHHRWLAFMYWEEADDVKIDVQCMDYGPNYQKIFVEDYRYPKEIYKDWIEKSVFGFAPGGSGAGSYRFNEVLQAGGIPVVVDNYVPPFYPDIDWSSCLVSIPVSRIIDIPNILRNISPAEVEQRQAACWNLFTKTIGVRDGKNDEHLMMMRALEIWWYRVQNMLNMESLLLSTHNMQH